MKRIILKTVLLALACLAMFGAEAATKKTIKYYCPVCKHTDEWVETSPRQHWCYGTAEKPHPKHKMEPIKGGGK
jgi:hypothetical protein